MGRTKKPSKWEDKGSHLELKLKHGTTIISKESYDTVKNFRWFTKLAITGKYYVYAHLKGSKKIMLHRLIINAKKGFCVDHVNGDTLDNRLSNLRIASFLENNRNAKKRKNCTSKYKGVTKRPSGNWGVYITFENKTICLGTYKEEKEAALIYNKYAKLYFKEFAKLNKIGEENENIHTNE